MSLNYNNLSSQMLAFTKNLSASELHGLICAYVCLYQSAAFKNIDWTLIDSLSFHGEDEEENRASYADFKLSKNKEFQSICKNLCDEVYEHLNSHSFEFEILIPVSGSIYNKASELGAWCRGFSYAVIKTISDMKASHQANYASLGLSPLGVEAMQDINEISQVDVDIDDDDFEQSYEELVEYLRVACQTIFEEISEFKTQNSPSDNQHYH